MPRVNRTISVSVAPDLEEDIEVRRKELGLSRSAYLQQIIRADLGLPTDLRIAPRSERIAEGKVSYRKKKKAS